MLVSLQGTCVASMAACEINSTPRGTHKKLKYCHQIKKINKFRKEIRPVHKKLTWHNFFSSMLLHIGRHWYWYWYWYLISDVEVFIPISDWTLITDIRLTNLIPINLADIGLILYPIFRIIDRYYKYHKNYLNSKIRYQMSLEMLVRYRR